MSYQKPFVVSIRFWQDFSDFRRFGQVLFLFVLLFLVIYRPFFLQNIEFLQLVIYSAIICSFSMLFSLFNFKIGNAYLRSFTENWSLMKELLWAVYHFGIIGSFNYLLTIFYLPNLSLSWLEVIVYTTFVGALPLAWDIYRRTKSNSKPENSVQNSILYIKSDGNYIEIYSYSGESIDRELVRSSMNDYNAKKDFVQCHRSYLVNWECVTEITGNSNGGILHLGDANVRIPYSRTYYPSLPELS